MNRTISTIIVGYKNDDLTVHYINDELSKLDVENIVVVVNNSSTKESCNFLKAQVGACVVSHDFVGYEEGYKVYVIDEKENLGFARANNLGVDFIRSFFPYIEYLLFSNNDVKIMDANVVHVLVEKINSIDGIGIITPNILGIDGKRQTPMPRGSLWQSTINPWINLLGKIFKIRRKKARYCDFANEGFHHTFSECFFLCRLKDFVSCGMMDPNTFLYSEGSILTDRMARIGLHYYFVPSVTVIHCNGTTTRKYISKDIAMMMTRSAAYYFKEYRHVSNFAIFLFMLSNKILYFLWRVKKFLLNLKI